MGTHILLDGGLFERKYHKLAKEFPEGIWQEILDLTEGDMDADRSLYMEDRFALRKDGMRIVQKGEAVLQIYRACVAECAILEYRSWTSDSFWADMENGGYGSRDAFWPRLRGKGQHEAYLSLLRTAGLGYAEKPPGREPWWLFSDSGIKGRFYGEWAALTPPLAALRVVEQLRQSGVVEDVISMVREESPGLAKNIERDHREVVEILDQAGKESHWVLGFEFGT
jgi:hypothetical protein